MPSANPHDPALPYFVATTMRTTTRQSMTTDEAAAHTLIHGTKADMRRLRADVAVAAGEQCPECPSTDIEDNGLHGRELEYRCCACDHRWEAAECTVRIPARARV